MGHEYRECRDRTKAFEPVDPGTGLGLVEKRRSPIDIEVHRSDSRSVGR